MGEETTAAGPSSLEKGDGQTPLHTVSVSVGNFLNAYFNVFVYVTGHQGNPLNSSAVVPMTINWDSAQKMCTNHTIKTH